jgi:hypothetical protein
VLKDAKFPVVSPDLLKGINFPVVSPDLLKGINFPVVSPDLLKGINFPVVSPDLLKGINFPVVPPEVFRAFQQIALSPYFRDRARQPAKATDNVDDREHDDDGEDDARVGEASQKAPAVEPDDVSKIPGTQEPPEEPPPN